MRHPLLRARLSFLLVLFLWNSLHVYSYAAAEPTVRVLIRRDVPQAQIGIWGPYEIYSRQTGKRLGMGNRLKTQWVRAGEGSVTVGENRWATPQLRVVSLSSGQPIRVNGRKFRGEVNLISKGEGKLWVINRVGVEEYLPGVLGWEAGSLWPREALKAQAVVSRTMVAHRIWISRDKEYDVTADVSTQVYGGQSSEKWLSAQACRETVGQVLSYQGELLSATFHANCGGHTEDAAELWQVKGDPAPLTGRSDPYCRDLKHFRWSARMTTDELMRALGESVGKIGRLQGCELLQRNHSGRVREIQLTGTQGSVTLSGREFRSLLGANRLRSLNFTLENSPREIFFRGLGWGHGVGFCQWGGYGMARQGKTADEILAFYFPGAQRRDLQGLPGFTTN